MLLIVYLLIKCGLAWPFQIGLNAIAVVIPTMKRNAGKTQSAMTNPSQSTIPEGVTKVSLMEDLSIQAANGSNNIN